MGKGQHTVSFVSELITVTLGHQHLVKRQVERLQKYKENPLTVVETFHSITCTPQRGGPCYSLWVYQTSDYLKGLIKLLNVLPQSVTFPVLLADLPQLLSRSYN